MTDQYTGAQRPIDIKGLAELTTKLLALQEDVSEIKNVMKDLAIALTKLALIEERQTVTNQTLERAFTAISRLESRLSDLERLAPINNQSRVWVERFVLAISGAAIAFIWDQLRR
jgi:hypothetical protein